MSTRQTNVIWSIIVVILIATIAYMAIDKKDDSKEDSQQTNQNKALVNEANISTDELDETNKWETYKDEKYNFQLTMMSDTNVSKRNYEEDNDKLTRPIISFERDIEKFDVSIWTDWTKGLDNFTYLDFPATREGTLDGQPAHIVEAPRGYCDISCTEPFIAYSANGEFGVINLVFYGDTKLDKTEQYILDSFKFTPRETVVSLKTYTNPVYKYSFDYPSQYELRAEGTRGQYVVDQASTSVVFAADEDDRLSFSDFMFKRVKLLCDADGVTGSATCPKYAKNPVAFKTTSGLTAYTLVFIEEVSKYKVGKDPVVTRNNKTLYAVDLGVGPSLTGGTTRMILAVHPINFEVAKDITMSVKKTN